MNENYIDFVADLRKINIENSPLTRDEKELAKTGVDCMSDLLKLIQTQPKQNITVMGMSLEEIRKIKMKICYYGDTQALQRRDGGENHV